MCGIFFAVELACTLLPLNDGHSDPFRTLSQKLRAANAARGPDAQRTRRMFLQSRSRNSDMDLDDASNGRQLALEFFVSELWLRGSVPIVQPHERDGDVFCWNGEIFEGMDIPLNENDGAMLVDKIHKLGSQDELVNLFGSIEGPYAFVFYHSASQRLFFALDPLGRRSLLIHKPTLANPYFLLASVSAGPTPEYCFEEVSTAAIYSIDLQQLGTSDDIVANFDSSMTALPRRRSESQILSPLPYAEPIQVNSSLPPEGPSYIQSLDHIPDFLSQPVDDFLLCLDKSVMLRVHSIPQALTADQARVAILFSGGIDSTILTLLAHRNLPLSEPIDLLNVAFENPRKIQIQGNHSRSRRRKNLRTDNAISGSLLAAEERNDYVSYQVPDRITGLQEVEELRRLSPGRVWNFVEVNVPYDESQAARPAIEALMWPRRTVMDLSLAMALYFASRGRGQLRCSSGSPDTKAYTSPARVLLSGLGSDELLGGYGRHRTAFQAGGWGAVINELQLELDRIPTRNLGRDDRVISSHGKEIRHPFLALSVVSFLARLPVHYKSDLRLAIGLGDKMLLRFGARKLGLVEASERKKRAMQFGSHSARMEGGEGERRGDLLLL